jgi:hypothetical protein
MHHANLEKLKSLRLFGMVRALQELIPARLMIDTWDPGIAGYGS